MITIRAFQALLPRFETRCQVRDRRRLLRARLHRGGHILKSCRKHQRCQSAMCPVCVRALRRSFITMTLARIKRARQEGQVPRDQIVAFSAVLAEEQHPIGKLHLADLRRINERLQRRHSRAKLPLVFAGADISYNEHSAGHWAPYWQMQVYGVVVGLPRKEVKERLGRNYPPADGVPRPLRVRECTDLPAALSYIIKPMFVRRVSYVDSTGRLNTRKVGLKPSQMQELAIWLGQYPMNFRYVLTGCRRYGDHIECNSSNVKI